MSFRTTLHRGLVPRSDLRALALGLLLGVGTVLAPAGPCAAQGTSSAQAPLEIRAGFMKSAKFVYHGAEPRKVHGWFGYSSDFTDLLGTHPAALEEANKAKPLFVTGVIGSAGIVAVSIKMLVGTINDAKDVQSGNIDAGTGTTSWTDIGLLAGFGAVTVVSALVAKGHVKRSVDLFNQAEGWSAAGGGPQLGFTLVSDGTPCRGLKVTLPM